MNSRRYLVSSILSLCALTCWKDAPPASPTEIAQTISRAEIYVAGCPGLHLDEDGTFVLYSICGMTVPDWDGRSGTYVRRDDDIVLSEEGRPQTVLTVEGDSVIWPNRFRMRPMGGGKPSAAEKNGD